MRPACSRAIITPKSAEHRWLRSSNAPGWVALPEEGVGFRFIQVEGGNAPRWMQTARYGTTWLRDALVIAGRTYVAGASEGSGGSSRVEMQVRDSPFLTLTSPDRDCGHAAL